MSLSKKLYVSRTTILQMLNDRNIDATDFNNFSQEELKLIQLIWFLKTSVL